MMYGIVDVGSNTVRMNIYKVEGDKMGVVLSKKEAVGLASYVKNGIMTAEGINRVCEVLADFRTLARDLAIEKFYVFATAALRNCSNSLTAVDEIMERTGIDVHVISGESEAELDFVGASKSTELKDGLLIDIGGGSTELVVYRKGVIRKKISLPLGSLNTYDQFVANLLPNRRERKAIKQAVLNELNKDPDLSHGKYPVVCGVGGTARAAARLNNNLFQLPVKNMRIKAPNIKKMIKLFENEEGESIPVETMEVLLKLVPDRARTIVPGMIVLNTLLKHFDTEWIEVTRAGARDGYLYRYVLGGEAPLAAAERAEETKEETPVEPKSGTEKND